MQKLLRIDSSARTTESHSRKLGDHFQNLWQRKFPEGQIVCRDLAAKPIDHITQSTIEGFYTPPEVQSEPVRHSLEVSNQLIEELKDSHTLLLTVPIYNFSVPSSLKAWIDQIVRINHTFSFDGKDFNGLMRTDNAVVICTYGASGYLKGEPFDQANYLQPYLEFLLQFLGIGKVDFVSLQSTTADIETVNKNTSEARLRIQALLAN
ncbi:MAG: NAD(P)H-dependent oxidoreductase [Pseudomonadota bacterium]